MNVRRMEAEVIRDSLLHLAGRLDSRMGGPDLPIDFAETGQPPLDLLPLRTRRSHPAPDHVRCPER